MGARIHFAFKQNEFAAGEPESYVVLYSHWGETTWRKDLALALDKARGRWDDSSYGARRVITELTREALDSDTGFGIYSTTRLDNFWDYSVLIDFTKQVVVDEGNPHSFNSFVEYQQEVQEYHTA
jgi:hypothetical protein